jgi:hypothetical protein
MPKVTSRRAKRRSAMYDSKKPSGVKTTRTTLPVHYGVIDRYDTGEKKSEVLRQKNGAQKEEEWKLGTTVHLLDGPALTIYDKDDKKIDEEKQPIRLGRSIDSSQTVEPLEKSSRNMSTGSMQSENKRILDKSKHIFKAGIWTHPLDYVDMYINTWANRQFSPDKKTFIGQVLHYTGTDEIIRFFVDLFKFIINSKKIATPLHVWRGDPFNAEAVIRENKLQFVTPRFTSTSVSKHVAHMFASDGNDDATDEFIHHDDDIVFDIKLPIGFPVCFISNYEFEVLLPPFITIVIDKIDTVDGNSQKIIRAHVSDWKWILSLRDDKAEHKKSITARLKGIDESISIIKSLRHIMKKT